MRRFKVLRPPTFCIILFAVWFVVLTLLYLPGLNAELFSTDDGASFLVPQFDRFDWNGLSAAFTPGSHVDFYPVRDLSYLLDEWIFNRSPLFMRLHQIAIFSAIAVMLWSILVRLGLSTWVAFFLTTLWAIHPVHAETVLWLSARKDLLSILFGLCALHVLIRSEIEVKKQFLIVLTFYLLCLGSKANFTLVPLAFLPLVIVKGNYRALFSVTCALGICWSLYQKWFYTSVNPMGVHWPFFTRLQLSASGLGRMLLGWIDPGLNTIDLDNFGQWLELNQSFAWAGAVGWILFIIIILRCWMSRRDIETTLWLGVGAVYLPISGLLFPHFNSYSVRYFEPVGIGILIGLTLFLVRKPNVLAAPILKVLLGFVLLLEGYALLQESRTWSTSVLVREKALSQSPESVSLKTYLLNDLLTNNRNKNENSKFELIREDLIRLCESPDSRNHVWYANCHSFFKTRYTLARGRDLASAEKYLAEFKSSRSIFSPLPRIVDRLNMDFALLSGKVLSDHFDKWSAHGFYPTEEYRFIRLAVGCLNSSETEDMRKLFSSWTDNRLIREAHFKDFVQELNENVKQKILSCLF